MDLDRELATALSKEDTKQINSEQDINVLDAAQSSISNEIDG